VLYGSLLNLLTYQIPPKLDKRGPEAKLHGELHLSDELSIHWFLVSIS